MPAWTNHLKENAALQSRLDETLGTGGLDAWSSWCTYTLTTYYLPTESLAETFIDDHFFDTFTSRTCHGHPLPCNSTGACVSDEDAANVYSIGDWEYNYIWNTAENATIYNQLTFGGYLPFIPTTSSQTLIRILRYTIPRTSPEFQILPYRRGVA